MTTARIPPFGSRRHLDALAEMRAYADAPELDHELAAARQELADAEARLAELSGAYNAARDRVTQARRVERRAVVELERAGRDRAARAALAAAGITFEGPLSIVVAVRDQVEVYHLAAFGPEGTPCYRYKPRVSRRHFHTEHAIPTDRAGEAQHLGYSALRDTGLVSWGNYDHRPKPPPEGGKWRWLKVDEQLPEGAR